MAPRKLQLKVGAEHAGQRLDQALAAWLPHAAGQPVSKSQARTLIVAGAVYLNGTRVRIASKELRVGARVDVFFDAQKLRAPATSRDLPFELTQDRILFEDEAIIVIDKPPGLPTQPTVDEARVNLFASVKAFLRKREGGDPYLGLHHRLDRDTSGVILFTKSTAANAGVARMFSEHTAQKVYNAISGIQSSRLDPRVRAAGEKGTWKIENFLGKVPGPGKRARFGAVRSGGDPALTEFRWLERHPGWGWVEAKPKTGRTHQIRVHLSEAGLPIFGDDLYSEGIRSFSKRNGSLCRLMLHAASLTFPHPLTNLVTSITSPIPKDFEQCLQRLRAGGEVS